MGQFSGRLFGYSHLVGGFPRGQAEYLGVPFADHGPIKVPDGLADEQVPSLSDIVPTGYIAAEFCNTQPGDTIAVWGCGPVGQFSIRSGFLLGAERVIAIDTVPERLALAAKAGALTLDFRQEDICDRVQELSGGRGADAVGTEANATSSTDSAIDRAKVATFMGTVSLHVLRHAIRCCRNFGTVSIVGVYGGFLDRVPMGSAIKSGLTFQMAQTPMQRYLPLLMQRIQKGEIDSSFVITRRVSLEGPEIYKTFRDKQDCCIKVVMQP